MTKRKEKERHGTVSSWQKGCRCNGCVDARKLFEDYYLKPKKGTK